MEHTDEVEAHGDNFVEYNQSKSQLVNLLNQYRSNKTFVQNHFKNTTNPIWLDEIYKKNSMKRKCNKKITSTKQEKPKQNYVQSLMQNINSINSQSITATLESWLQRYSRVMSSFEFWLYLMNAFGLWRYRHLVLQLRRTTYILFQLLWGARFVVDNSALPAEDSYEDQSVYEYQRYHQDNDIYGDPYGGDIYGDPFRSGQDMYGPGPAAQPYYQEY
ncbi:hypothetical protein AKO1_011008 [Acrasis kona]|uniref:Uncharacterized protein n=1 Tax=Acrasis kona TaxID=1008807 RepID=A0AAW2YTH5_9EUKA